MVVLQRHKRLQQGSLSALLENSGDRCSTFLVSFLKLEKFSLEMIHCFVLRLFFDFDLVSEVLDEMLVKMQVVRPYEFYS